MRYWGVDDRGGFRFRERWQLVVGSSTTAARTRRGASSNSLHGQAGYVAVFSAMMLFARVYLGGTWVAALAWVLVVPSAEAVCGVLVLLNGDDAVWEPLSRAAALPPAATCRPLRATSPPGWAPCGGLRGALCGR